MVYEKIIYGKFVNMRSITVEDAKFSYDIRSDAKFCNIVGQPAQSVDEQYRFIENQMVKPDDYYFVVLNKKNEKIGLIGVYDIHDGIGEVGREVSYGNPMETMEAEVLLEDFYVDVLHLKKICSVIYVSNKKQISSQRKAGYIPLKRTVRNGIDCFYYETSLECKRLDRIRQLLDKIEVQE